MFEDKKGKIAQLIIARLDGKDIKRRFKYYESLVKKGIGGFVIFGGRLDEVITGIKRLQDIAKTPLFICSDLEQGLGQQIKGGTLFPPTMAIAQAINPHSRRDVKLLRDSINIIANEAKATGINVIFSPVLDVNTNPKNPIICTRAFSDNPETVAWFGKEFIKGFQSEGIIACAKHFPGHGDTVEDSHKGLPVVRADIKRMQKVELYPFYSAIKAGVKMIMLGHLKVPVIDPKRPTSLSEKTIKGFLRDKMGFQGLVTTDAMNMQAIKLEEEVACLMALKAGADIILHPSDPRKIIDYLSSRYDEIKERVEGSYLRVLEAKKEIKRIQDVKYKIQDIGAKASWDLAYKLTRKSITITKNVITESKDTPYLLLRTTRFKSTLSEPMVIILDDDNNKSGKPFINILRKKHKRIKHFYIDNNFNLKNLLPFTHHSLLIIAVFSKVSAWKGRSGLSAKLNGVLKRAIRDLGYSVLIGFCSPYILEEFSKCDIIINAYSGSEQAQEAVVELLCGP